MYRNQLDLDLILVNVRFFVRILVTVEARLFVCSGTSLLQTGKLNMSQTIQDWSCGSGCSPPLNCRLAICTNIAFPQAFSGSGKVKVFLCGTSEPQEMLNFVK